MADGDENTTDTEVPETDDVFEGEFDPDRAKAKIKKANAEAAGLRARLKAAEEKNAKLAEYEKVAKEVEDSKKSETEKFAELSAVNQKLQRQIWQTEVRDELGLTRAQMKYISGDSLEELKANAESFKKDVLGASATDNDEEVEFDEEAAEAELSPFGNRRTVADVSRSRATGDAGDSEGFDPEKVAAKVRSGVFFGR
jgi:multidrug resistance efflux pump